MSLPFAEGFTLNNGTSLQDGVQDGVQDSVQDGVQVTTQDKIDMILSFCTVPRVREEMQQHIGIASREYFRINILKPLLDSGQLKMTIPNKPNSGNQRYIAATINEKGN